MNLRTDIQVPPSDWKIDHRTRLLALGSCFADRLGQRLHSLKFPISVNPLGIVYHPEALVRLLDWATESGEDADFAASIWEREGQVGSFWLHSQVNASARVSFEVRVKALREQLRAELAGADVLLLTLGTAWGQVRKATGKVAANCHRFPGADFAPEMATVGDVEQRWGGFLGKWLGEKAGRKVLLTVSPIRHVRTGMVRNGASKAVLRAACHALETSLGGAIYFPSYEIMLDDLRDYRFYERDLIHPNELALDHIWNQFSQAYFSDATLSLLQQLQQLHRDLAHRPVDPFSATTQSFQARILTKIEALSLHFDMEPERSRLAENMPGTD